MTAVSASMAVVRPRTALFDAITPISHEAAKQPSKSHRRADQISQPDAAFRCPPRKERQTRKARYHVGAEYGRCDLRPQPHRKGRDRQGLQGEGPRPERDRRLCGPRHYGHAANRDAIRS